MEIKFLNLRHGLLISVSLGRIPDFSSLIEALYLRTDLFLLVNSFYVNVQRNDACFLRLRFERPKFQPLEQGHPLKCSMQTNEIMNK